MDDNVLRDNTGSPPVGMFAAGQRGVFAGDLTAEVCNAVLRAAKITPHENFEDWVVAGVAVLMVRPTAPVGEKFPAMSVPIGYTVCHFPENSLKITHLVASPGDPGYKPGDSREAKAKGAFVERYPDEAEPEPPPLSWMDVLAGKDPNYDVVKNCKRCRNNFVGVGCGTCAWPETKKRLQEQRELEDALERELDDPLVGVCPECLNSGYAGPDLKVCKPCFDKRYRQVSLEDTELGGEG